MSSKKDILKPVGVFRLKTYDAAGKLLDDYEDRNLIVNGGRDAIVRLIGAGTAGKRVSQIAFGTNGGDPIITDVVIASAFVKPTASVSYPSNGTVQFDFTLELNENNGVTIREYGLLCVDNTLFSRKVRAAIDKTSAIRLEGTWSITF